MKIHVICDCFGEPIKAYKTYKAAVSSENINNSEWITDDMINAWYSACDAFENEEDIDNYDEYIINKMSELGYKLNNEQYSEFCKFVDNELCIIKEIEYEDK